VDAPCLSYPCLWKDSSLEKKINYGNMRQLSGELVSRLEHGYRLRIVYWSTLCVICLEFHYDGLQSSIGDNET